MLDSRDPHRLAKSDRMEPLSTTNTEGGSTSQATLEDGKRTFFRSIHSGDDGTRRDVLVVKIPTDRSAADMVDRLKHEYELRNDLDKSWALRPIELVCERDQTKLTLTDPGGEPLDHLIGAPIELGSFLRLAIALSNATGRMHERGLVHKDIKPANVFVNSANEQVWLTGFGIAARLPRERQPPARSRSSSPISLCKQLLDSSSAGSALSQCS